MASSFPKRLYRYIPANNVWALWLFTHVPTLTVGVLLVRVTGLGDLLRVVSMCISLIDHWWEPEFGCGSFGKSVWSVCPHLLLKLELGCFPSSSYSFLKVHTRMCTHTYLFQDASLLPDLYIKIFPPVGSLLYSFLLKKFQLSFLVIIYYYI